MKTLFSVNNLKKFAVGGAEIFIKTIDKDKLNDIIAIKESFGTKVITPESSETGVTNFPFEGSPYPHLVAKSTPYPHLITERTHDSHFVRFDSYETACESFDEFIHKIDNAMYLVYCSDICVFAGTYEDCKKMLEPSDLRKLFK